MPEQYPYRKNLAKGKAGLVAVLSAFAIGFIAHQTGLPPSEVADKLQGTFRDQSINEQAATPGSALAALGELAVKGRAAKTGYAREQFGAGWAEVDGCDMRNLILQRDLSVKVLGADACTVLSGTLTDPYTNKTIAFQRGAITSDDVQIDHVVALSDAWQKGAQGLDIAGRAEFSNDPLNLLAVDGPTNQAKGDSDAASWLPPVRNYRCQFVARQIAVKAKYELWVTAAERDAMRSVLRTCPDQPLPTA